MLRNIAYASSLVGLAAAVPQAYGSAKPYDSAKASPHRSPSPHHHTPAHNTPAFSGYPYKPSVSQAPHVTVTDHITVTDHVTATEGSCSGSAGAPAAGSASVYAAGGASAAPSGGSPPAYAANTVAISSIASAQTLPKYTPVGMPTGQPAAPAQTLAPAQGPTHDANNLTHLAPATSGNLYYSNGNTDVEHMFASLDMNYTKPAIVLENSAYISNVTCSTDGLGLTFNGDEGYNYAKQQWPTFGGDFIMVSHSDGCKNATQAQRTFWQVTDAQFDDGSKACDVKCSEINITQAATDMTASWGKYKNDLNSNTAGTPTSASAAAAAQITTPPSDDDLAKRGWWGDLTSKVGSVAGDVTSVVGSEVSKATSAAASVVSDVTSKAVEAADKTFSTDMSINLAASPTAKASAPWDNAAEIVSISGIDAYCVDCNLKGSAEVEGTAEISFLQAEIKSGTFSLKGNMAANLGLGLNSEDGASFSPFSKEVELVQIPLSPIEIPELLVIGPYINIDASVNIDMEASGKMLVSVGASMPNFDAEIDLKDSSKNKQSGFTPEWTHKFEAEGETTVSLTLGLPVEIGFGIDVRALPKLNASVSLTNTASVTGYGNYSNEEGDSCQYGIGWGIHFNEDVDFSALDFFNKNIYSYQSPDVASGCIPNIGGKTPDNTTSTSSDSSSTPTPTPKTPGASSATGKHSGAAYTPTNSPASPTGGPSTPTGKTTGKAYSPTYSSASPATPSASASQYESSHGASATPTPSGGSPYSPPKGSDTPKASDSSSKNYPSAPSATPSASKSTMTTSTKKHTPTPKASAYNPPK